MIELLLASYIEINKPDACMTEAELVRLYQARGAYHVGKLGEEHIAMIREDLPGLRGTTGIVAVRPDIELAVVTTLEGGCGVETFQMKRTLLEKLLMRKKT